MKRFFLIIITLLVVFNVCGTIAILKRKGVDISLNMIMDVYTEINIYALECGIIIVVVDWVSRKWFKNKK